MHTYTHTHAYTLTQTHNHKHIHTHTHTHTHTYTLTQTHTRTHSHTYTHTQIYMNTLNDRIGHALQMIVLLCSLKEMDKSSATHNTYVFYTFSYTHTCTHLSKHTCAHTHTGHILYITIWIVLLSMAQLRICMKPLNVITKVTNMSLCRFLTLFSIFPVMVIFTVNRYCISVCVIEYQSLSSNNTQSIVKPAVWP